MTTKLQYIKNAQGEILDTITHIMSEHGHFEKDGFRVGCHIAFGSQADQTGYTEVIDEGVTHIFPDSFPDIIVSDEEETEESEVNGEDEE